MFTFVLVIHIIVSLMLMLVILLQDGKGGDIVSALGGGGGSQTLFGSTGAGNFLTRATITLTIIFVLTSLGLAVLKTRESRSVLDTVETPAAAEQPAAIQGGPKKEGETEAPAVTPEAGEKTPEATAEEPSVEGDSTTQPEQSQADTPAQTEPEPPGKNS